MILSNEIKKAKNNDTIYVSQIELLIEGRKPIILDLAAGRNGLLDPMGEYNARLHATQIAALKAMCDRYFLEAEDDAFKDFVPSDKMAARTVEDFLEVGWTRAQLVSHGFLTPPELKEE